MCIYCTYIHSPIQVANTQSTRTEGAAWPSPGRSCIFPRWQALQGPELGGTQGWDPTVRYETVQSGPAQHGTVRCGAVHTFKDGTCHTYTLPTYILHTCLPRNIHPLADKIERRRHDVDRK